MSLSYDVVIAGGGPAGAAAARVLAGRGASVALLDKAVFPRNKLCGGLLTWKTVRTLKRVFGLDEAELHAAGLVDFQADSYSLRLLGREVSRDQGVHPFLLVNRTRFDHHLLGLAREAGTEVHQGVGAVHCIPGKGVVATSDGREFSGRFIIGADGANSRLRRALGVDKTAWQANLATALEFHLPRSEAPAPLRDLAEPQLHAGHLKAGYGWVFPNSEHLCIGMCGLVGRRSEMRVNLSGFLTMLGIDSVDVNLKAHPLPYGNWLENPCRERLLLAGDAAGLVEPLLGEGIFYALATGRYAAEAVADALKSGTEGGGGADGMDAADPAAAYRARLRQHILPELKGSAVVRRVVLGSINLMGYQAFTAVMRLARRPLVSMVHGHRSWRFMRPKTWDF